MNINALTVKTLGLVAVIFEIFSLFMLLWMVSSDRDLFKIALCFLIAGVTIFTVVVTLGMAKLIDKK